MSHKIELCTKIYRTHFEDVEGVCELRFQRFQGVCILGPVNDLLERIARNKLLSESKDVVHDSASIRRQSSIIEQEYYLLDELLKIILEIRFQDARST